MAFLRPTDTLCLPPSYEVSELSVGSNPIHPSSLSLPSPIASTAAARRQYLAGLSNNAENFVNTSVGDVYLAPPLAEDTISSIQPTLYNVASRFTERVTYLFRPLSPNTMVLVPPDLRPQYHISVGSNCFIPSSYITTVRRGGSENDEFVAEFEMGKSKLPESLYIRGEEHLIKQVIKTCKSLNLGRNVSWKDRQLFYNNHQEWTLKNMEWNLSEDTKICTTSSRTSRALKMLYAKFTPRRGHKPAQLEVTPEGQELFDDILLSVLILERRRLMLDSTNY
ncbi:hypothetical protein DFS33DRAFT_1483145 [Desarmillaria ectypa]|nr:hypothetical protein DFS33DRAFT_1483145 [Desarmillaria ectypa]